MSRSGMTVLQHIGNKLNHMSRAYKEILDEQFASLIQALTPSVCSEIIWVSCLQWFNCHMYLPCQDSRTPQTQFFVDDFEWTQWKTYLKVNFSNHSSWNWTWVSHLQPNVWAIIIFSPAVTFERVLFNIAWLFKSLMRLPGLWRTTGNNHRVTKVAVQDPVPCPQSHRCKEAGLCEKLYYGEKGQSLWFYFIINCVWTWFSFVQNFQPTSWYHVYPSTASQKVMDNRWCQVYLLRY